jgi:hypothetical protein
MVGKILLESVGVTLTNSALTLQGAQGSDTKAHVLNNAQILQLFQGLCCLLL